MTSQRLLGTPLIFGLVLGLSGMSAGCSAGGGSGDDDSGTSGVRNGDDNGGGIGPIVGDGDSAEDGDDLDENNPDCDSVLTLTIRDFEATHPDMESYQGMNDIGCGMVAPTIGDSLKPQFVSGIGSQKRVTTGEWDGLRFAGCEPYNGWSPDWVITSEESFDQWYRDVPEVNQTFEIDVVLTDDGTGNYVYDNSAFFPIDGMGFGDNHQDERGASHNFHFTTEAHLEFGYIAGQEFTFRGDDDLWIYVNGKLALDLGGTHLPIEATIDFDAQATELDIAPNNTYRMDIFHAERHTGQSNFRITTNISCFTTVPVPRVR